MAYASYGEGGRAYRMRSAPQEHRLLCMDGTASTHGQQQHACNATTPHSAQIQLE